jgi:hypothetical protein
MAERKLTDEQVQEIGRRFAAGETQDDLAKEFSVTRTTIFRKLMALGVKRIPPPKATSHDMMEFQSRARSILWRQDHSKEKPTYAAWEARVKALESPDGGGMTHNQAVIRASKEWPCLSRLFREYNVTDFDPNPDSHPAIQQWGKPAIQQEVVCEGREQSYRDSLRWAIEAAGTYLRTGRQPSLCPCDAAWYLFKQAVDEPKDFLAKVGQIESKGDSESEERRNARKDGKRSVAELDSMLAEIELEEREDG